MSLTVESISLHGMTASSQCTVKSLPLVSIPSSVMRSLPMIISYRSKPLSTTCNDLDIFLLACSSGSVNTVLLVLRVVLNFPAAVCHFFSEELIFNGMFLALLLASIDSLAPLSISALTIRVLVSRFFLPLGTLSCTNSIGL